MKENEQLAEFKLMVEKLVENTKLVKFGEVFLSLKIHDSRIVAVTHSMTSNEIKKTFNIGVQNGR